MEVCRSDQLHSLLKLPVCHGLKEKKVNLHTVYWLSPHYLPLLVDELLWSFTAQTVHQLGVIASIAANQLAQQRGPSAGLSRAN